MTVGGWAEIGLLLASVGYGTISAVVPIANAEAYVAASQVARAAGPVWVAVGIGTGQTIGKSILFYGVRRGREFPLVRHRRAVARAQPVGPVHARLRSALAGLLTLVGRKRWGLPITFVAAVVGLPPLYAVALLAGATKMRLGHFAGIVFVGRVLRFLLVAYGVVGLHLRPG